MHLTGKRYFRISRLRSVVLWLILSLGLFPGSFVEARTSSQPVQPPILSVCPFDKLFDVFLGKAGKAWSVGYGGKIIHSDDCGRNWTRQESGTGKPLFSVFFTDLQKGWIVGELGTILHTTDGGKK